MRFSRQELREIFVSWLVLSLVFALPVRNFKIFLTREIPLYFVIVGTAFVLHEVAHKYAATRYGLFAEYRMWRQGLLLAFLFAVATNGSIIFAAPGAVYIYGVYITKEMNGRISAAGPGTNLFVAFLFVLIAKFFAIPVAITVAKVNAFLAVFNLLPFFVLDGRKVFRYNPMLWGLLFFSGIAFLIY